MEAFRAPDLANGAIFHNVTAANAWATEIQAVLVERRGEEVRTLHLAHECRKERLPLGHGPLGGGEGIFMRDKPHDFLTFTLDGQFWEVPHFDTMVSQAAVRGIEVVRLGTSLFFLPATGPDCQAYARCPSVPAVPVSWADLHRALTEGSLLPRRLFCRFAWEEDGRWELYFPVRYVNFPTTAAAGSYLQPIAGTVLVPFRHSFLPAYIACAASETGDTITEFLVPRYVEATDWLARGYGFDGDAAPFAKLREAMPAYVRVFDWVRRVSGCLTFYVYDEAHDAPAGGTC